MVPNWAREVSEILTQRSIEHTSFVGRKSDLTSPTNNNILDIDITVSVVYDTF